jgi:hypothetical protein
VQPVRIATHPCKERDNPMARITTYIWIMQLSTGLLLIALAVPLILGKIGPNLWYGFRVRRTLDDPAVWYKANAYAGKSLIFPAIAMIVFSTTFYLVPVFDPLTYATACTVVCLGSLGISVIYCFRFLGQITKNSNL